MTSITDPSALFRALLRTRLTMLLERAFRDLEPGTPFAPNWHYDAMAHQLDRVARGELHNLIINVPPRSGKSLLVTVVWPLFLWGQEPSLRILCVSHTDELAREFSLKRKAIAQSAWYKALFPLTRLARVRDLELTTTAHGSILGVGVGGAVLGRGADLIIVDDPLKGIEAASKAGRARVNDFYDNTLVTRLNDKKEGAMVIVMQRLHQEDLVGHVLERGGWKVVSFPAIALEDTVHRLSDRPGDVHRRRVGDLLHPEREPMEVLERVRRAQGSLLFEAQYQQNPLPAGGNVIKRAWLRYYDEPPERFDRVVVSWDPASTLGDTSDWSVGTVWGSVGLDYYLLEVVRVQLETPDLRRAIVRLTQTYDADATLVEAGDIGRAIVQDLRQTGPIRPMLQQPRFDKEARLLAQAARFEAGQVHVPTDAPWLGVYLEELLAFPNGRHDDQVDSTSQALTWLTARTPVQREMVRRNIARRNPTRTVMRPAP